MHHSLIKAFAVGVIRFRLAVILIFLLSIVAGLYAMKDLKFDNSNEMWFLKDDQALLSYQRLLDIFGDDEFVVVALENKEKTSLFNQTDITTIHEISEFLKEQDLVVKVQSISKAEIILGEEDGLTVKKLFKRFDLTDREYKEKERVAVNDPLIEGLLLTSDATFTIITARTKHIAETIDFKIEFVHALETYLDTIRAKERYNLYVGGSPVIDENFLTQSIRDQVNLTPIITVVILVILLYSFRSFFGVFLPIAVIGSTIIYVYGYMGLREQDMNVLNTILPIIVLAIGIADSVHILVDYYHEIGMGRTVKKAAENCIVNLFSPCFFTSITTSIGFLAFTSSRLLPLKEFGEQAAFGVFLAFILSVTVLPACLSYLKSHKDKARTVTEENIFFHGILKVAKFTPGQIKLILFVATVMTAFFFFSMSKVKVDANAMNYFKDGSPIKVQTKYIDSQLKGTYNLEVIIDSGTKGGVKEPEFLRELETIHEFLDELPEFGRVISLLDFIKKMNQVMHEDRAEFYRIPDSREEVAQYLLLYSFSSPQEDLTDMVDYDYRITRVSVRIPIMDTSEYKAIIAKVESFFQKEVPQAEIDLTGLIILFNNIDEYIFESLITSFSIALVLIFLMMIIVFRSFKYGCLSMIPNLFPVFAAGGLMGVLGVNLEFGTVMVACVVIGIGVDDSIHYISRYLRKKRGGVSRRTAIEYALEESGKPIVFTSVILFFGFGVLLFASFVFNIYFGMLVCIAIVIALLADLILLSAIILIYPESKKKKAS